ATVSALAEWKPIMPAGRAMVPMLRRRQAGSSLQSGLSSTPAPPSACAMHKRFCEKPESAASLLVIPVFAEMTNKVGSFLTFAAEFVKEGVVDLVHGFRLHADQLVLEQFDQLLAVDQFDWHHAFARGFCLGIRSEAAGGDEYTLLGAAEHGIAEFAHGAARDGVLVALGLEHHAQTHEGVESQQALAVNATVARTLGDFDVLEPVLTQQAAADQLEAVGRQGFEDIE